MLRILCCFLLSLCATQLRAQGAGMLPLLGHWDDTTHCPENAAGQHWNTVWGYAANGKEYAILGGTRGCHIVDLDTRSEVAFLPQSPEDVVHRDCKTYRHYLYCISGEGNTSRLQAYDLSSLPGAPSLVWQSNPDSVSRALCMFIDTARARLYLGTVVGNLYGSHSLASYSLANPAAPVFLGFSDDYDPTHGLYVRHDTAWCSNGWGGFVILDLSQVPRLRALGGITDYLFKGYNHSSWIGPDQIGVMSDEDFGLPLKVIDTRQPTRIQVLSYLSVPDADSNSMPHNPYLLGHLCFVAYYQDGLQVFDLSNPAQPVRVGYYDTYPGPRRQQYAGAWACYPYLPSRRILVSDMQTGLYVLDAHSLLAAPPAPGHPILSVCPNPASHVLHLQLSSALPGPFRCEIWDALGRLVWNQNLLPASPDKGLDISLPPTWAPGTYVLRLSQGAEVFSARFIKP